ncbi:MAG TPA: hypothetical protein VJZ93_01410 [Candidatus Nanoarchaeia archaeon]|nr:hypothetical protein [Candidatus Nanoarchaeia archaeon]
MEFEERTKYELNERQVWYLGETEGERLFGDLEDFSNIVVYPVTEKEIKVIEGKRFRTEKNPCYVMRREHGASSFDNMFEKFPKEAYGGIIR